MEKSQRSEALDKAKAFESIGCINLAKRERGEEIPKSKRVFSVGDKVRVKMFEEEVGSVCHVTSMIGVCFPQHVLGRHDCEGTCTDGHGYYYYAKNLEHVGVN